MNTLTVDWVAIYENVKAARRKIDQIDRLRFGDLNEHFDKIARDLDWALNLIEDAHKREREDNSQFGVGA